MKPIIKLKKGLNLRLIGEAPLTLKQALLTPCSQQIFLGLFLAFR